MWAGSASHCLIRVDPSPSSRIPSSHEPSTFHPSFIFGPFSKFSITPFVEGWVLRRGGACSLWLRDAVWSVEGQSNVPGHSRAR